MTLKFMLVNNLSSFFSPTNLMSILESVQIFNRVIRKLTFLIVFLLFFMLFYSSFPPFSRRSLTFCLNTEGAMPVFCLNRV